LPKDEDEDNNTKNNIMENFSVEEIHTDSIEKSKKDPYSSFRILFFIFIFMLTLGFSIFIVVSSRRNSKINNSDKFESKRNSSNDWNFKFDNFGTESCIRLFDIDEDGLFV
jgi:quinol-cytochrome oxidoreductase complex cytochrome b subunit